MHRAARSTLDSHFIDRSALRLDIDARYPTMFKVTAMRHDDRSLMCDMRSRMQHRCVSAATGVCC
jgi:DNA polymerase II large subunit